MKLDLTFLDLALIAVILWLAACVPGLVAESRDAALYASQRAAVEAAFGVK